MSASQPSITCTDWSAVREEVAAVKPELAAIIDKISPDKTYRLYRVKYRYGDLMVRQGKLQLPDSNGILRSLEHPESLDPQIVADLNYNLDSNPVTLVLSKALELFFNAKNRTILFAMASTGTLFGGWKLLDPKISFHPAFLWDISAGARSAFMLPKISEANGHLALKKQFRTTADKPTGLFDHWHVFKEIANHDSFSEPWETEVLLFSSAWFAHLEDPAWVPLHHYMLNSSWKETDYLRNQVFWNSIFSLLSSEVNARFAPHILDTVRHLFTVAAGGLPGYVPAQNSDYLPMQGLQEAYTDVYGLIKYPPILMQPGHFDPNDKTSHPIYYALKFPSAMEFTPKHSSRVSTIGELSQVAHLLGKYQDALLNANLRIEYTPFYSAAANVNFSYLHSDPGTYNTIIPSASLPALDPRFDAILKRYPGTDLPTNSSFLRGCVQIAHK
jgi:hypothetical protein